MCVEDVRYILDYFRLSADKRMIFGGGTVYGGTDPADVRAKIRPNLEKVFPSLKGVKIDYAWRGNFAEEPAALVVLERHGVVRIRAAHGQR